MSPQIVTEDRVRVIVMDIVASKFDVLSHESDVRHEENQKKFQELKMGQDRMYGAVVFAKWATGIAVALIAIIVTMLGIILANHSPRVGDILFSHSPTVAQNAQDASR